MVLSRIEESGLMVFTPLDVRRFLGISTVNTNKILQRMKLKGLIVSLEKGKYIRTDTFDDLDIYELATGLYRPSYLALWSALHYHHMTNQVPTTVLLATTGRKRKVLIRDHELLFVKMKRDLFFGYELIGRTLVSDREKTLIDCLRFPEHSGGMDHIYGSIPEDIDTDRMVEYCEMARSTSIASRLGFMMERKGLNFDVEKVLSMITTYTLLDPSCGRRDADPKWKLYVNKVIP
jgi:predicted transcriptional regulator of viral defense system